MTFAQSEPTILDNPQREPVESIPQSDTDPPAFLKALAGLRFVPAHIGPLGVAAIVLGTIVSVSGAIWAIRLGTSYPIAIMAAYCTLVATACLTLALTMLPKQESKRDEPVSATPSVSEAWKHVNTLCVSDAARLWCEVEPGATVTQDIIAWARLLLDAIASGELACVQNDAQSNHRISYPSDKPHWSTHVTRDALQAWARARGFSPRFLQDP